LCFLQALILRHAGAAWLNSIAFEFIELSFQHWMPNFAECWYDYLNPKPYTFAECWYDYLNPKPYTFAECWYDHPIITKITLKNKRIIIRSLTVQRAESCYVPNPSTRWDHMILDVLVCNALGIFLGHVFIHYFEVKDYDWMNISAFETTQGKVRRFAEQVRDSIGTPEPFPGLGGLFPLVWRRR